MSPSANRTRANPYLRLGFPFAGNSVWAVSGMGTLHATAEVTAEVTTEVAPEVTPEVRSRTPVETPAETPAKTPAARRRNGPTTQETSGTTQEGSQEKVLE